LQKIKVVAISVVAILLVSVVAIILWNHYGADSESFYVGVTYCGESPEEAKQLIDRVKDYTNLFVLQSGPLQNQLDNITEIGDYAVSSGMHFLFCFGKDRSELMKTWLDAYDGHWKDKFLGIYFADEPGGRMIDGSVAFGNFSGYYVSKGPGMVSVHRPDNVSINYSTDGRIMVHETNGTDFRYEPKGEITKVFMFDNGTHTQLMEVPVDPSEVESYEDLCNANPLLTYESTANVFVDDLNTKMECLQEKSVTAFTSDYVLYWFDYLSGYDVVMAQVGWNHTIEQDIALVRGAANMQNKTWGAMITWKYNHSPYLDTGEAIFNQMSDAYEAGAEYAIIFNYAPNMTGPYGTLQEEHFVALERFWNEVVQNPDVKQGSIEAEAVLVLPENYGWGMRNPKDKIWGLWEGDEQSQQIWDLLQALLDQYGSGLDIIYEDSRFPVEGKYPNIFYWNQTF
jgi:hypothetical protein